MQLQTTNDVSSTPYTKTKSSTLTTIQNLIFFSVIFSALSFGPAEEFTVALTEIILVLVATIWVIKAILNGSFVMTSSLAFKSAILFLALNVALLPFSLYYHGSKIEIIKYASCLLVFIVAVNTFDGYGGMKKLLNVVICAGFVVAIMTIILTLHGKLFSRIDTNRVVCAISLWLTKLYLSFNGPFMHSNFCAGYVGSCIPLTAATAFIQTTIHRKMLYFFILTVMFVGQFLTLSRGGIGAMFLALTLFTVFYYKFITKKINNLLFLGVSLFLAVIVTHFILSEMVNISEAARKTVSYAQTVSPSFLVRLTFWKDTLSIIHDYQFFGTGLGSFPEVYTEYATQMSRIPHPHNEYFKILSESGITGSLIIFAGLLIWYMKTFKKIFNCDDERDKCIGIGGMASLLAIAVTSQIK